MDKKAMLTQLIQQYEDGNKTRFAKRLGLTPQGISTWLSRGTIDYELVYAKCECLNAAWLLTGRGSMLLGDQNQLPDQVPLQPTPVAPSGSSPDESFIYMMYEKEKEENRALIEEIGALKERLRQMDTRQNEAHRQQQSTLKQEVESAFLADGRTECTNVCNVGVEISPKKEVNKPSQPARNNV